MEEKMSRLDERKENYHGRKKSETMEDKYQG